MINRIEGYHTHYLGKYDKGNMFWGDVPFINKKIDNKTFRTDYAVLYKFDPKGKLIDYQYWKGTNFTDIYEPWYKIDEFVKKLKRVKFCNISVELFELKIDNEKFGLIANPEFDCVNAQPSSILSFYEPWDGEYYT